MKEDLDSELQDLSRNLLGSKISRKQNSSQEICKESLHKGEIRLLLLEPTNNDRKSKDFARGKGCTRSH